MAIEAPPGFFRITAVVSGVATAGRLGENPPTIAGGVGGWGDGIGRWKREPLSEWGGPSTRRLTLDVMFDGWRAQESVESAIANLERLATAGPGDIGTPVVRVSGQMPRTDLDWVIDDVTFGDAVWNGGVRMRQRATITLVEYVEGKLLIVTPKPIGPTKLAQVRKGDNLKKMSARVLGNANRWREIAKLNGRETYTLTSAAIGTYLKVPPR